MQSDKIAALVKSANVTVESYWPSLFAKLAEKRNVGDLVMNIGAGDGGAAAPVAVSSSAPAAASAAAPVVEEKKVKLMAHFLVLIKTQCCFVVICFSCFSWFDFYWDFK